MTENVREWDEEFEDQQARAIDNHILVLVLTFGETLHPDAIRSFQKRQEEADDGD